MASRNKMKGDRVCEICGSIGKFEELVTCYRCKKATEHIYCMKDKLFDVPQLWYCEECISSPYMVDTETLNACKGFNIADGSSCLGINEFPNKRTLVCNNTQSPGHSEAEKEIGGSSTILDNYYKGTAVVVQSTSQHRMSPLCQRISPKVFSAQKTKLLPPEEVVLLKSGVRSRTHGSSCLLFHRSNGKIMHHSTSRGKASPVSVNSKTFKLPQQPNEVSSDADARRSAAKFITSIDDDYCSIEKLKGSGTAFDSTPGFRRTGFHEMTSPLVLIPTRHVCWMGRFGVHDLVSHEYGGIQAQFPPVMCVKVYDIWKHLPEILKFKLLERSKVWPKMFQLDPPTETDIGLYFFPSEEERHKEKYIRLLERLHSRDQAMRGWVNGVELLVFVSNQLPADSQRIDGKHYLWAVFHHLKHKKLFQQTKVQSPVNNCAAAVNSYSCAQLNVSSQRNHKEIDLLWHQEQYGTDKSAPSPDTPHGFPEARNPNCEKHSSVKFPLEKVASPINPDIPPCFSKLDPHSNSFSGTISNYSHAQLNVPTRIDHKEVEMVEDKGSDRTGKSTPSVDAPHGFPEATNPNSEKPSAVKSLMEKMACPTDPDIPPGFSKLDPSLNSPSAAMSRDNVSHMNVPSQRNHKEVDMEWSKEINRKGKSTPNFDTPPGFPKAIDQNCKKRSFVKSPKEVANPITPDVPPGFSKLNPPGFHLQMNSKHQSSHLPTPAVTGYVPDSKPPGFPKAIYQNCKKRSFVKSPKEVANPITPDVPPGFSKLNPTGFHLQMISKHQSIHLPSPAVTGYVPDSKPCEVHPKCHQASDNWPSPGERTRISHLMKSVEQHKSSNLLGSPDTGTKQHSSGKNLSYSSATEKACSPVMLDSSWAQSVHRSSSPWPRSSADENKPIPLVSDVCEKSSNSSELPDSTVHSGTSSLQTSKRICPVEFLSKKLLEETEETGNHMEMNSENQQCMLSVSHQSQSSTRTVLESKRVDSNDMEGTEKREIFQSKTDTQNKQISSCNTIAVPSESDSEENDMEIDMEGGIEVGMIDVPVPRVNTQPTFSNQMQEV